MERGFGHDFRRVRVHSDDAAFAAARALGAVAYTVAPHVVFAQARYAPNSTSGRGLLAHELAHVVQQETTASPPVGVGSRGDVHERRADEMAAEVMRGRRVTIESAARVPRLHRLEDDATPPLDTGGAEALGPQLPAEQQSTPEETKTTATSSPCSPPPDHPCESGKVKMVTAGFAVAKAWLPSALRKIEAYNAAPTDAKNRAAATALKRHFTWTEAVRSEATYPDIPKKFVPSVINTLAGQVDKGHDQDCLTSCEAEEGKQLMAEVPKKWQGQGGNCFAYTPCFFRPTTDRARWILHEMCHQHAGMERDPAYEGGKDYPPRVGVAGENPDSYACLIRDLGK